MKKFTFELQKVLEFRNFEKEQAEGELAKALAVETEINDNLKKIAQNYSAVKASMKGNLDFQDVMAQSQYNNLLEYQKEEYPVYILYTVFWHPHRFFRLQPL